MFKQLRLKQGFKETIVAAAMIAFGYLVVYIYSFAFTYFN